VEINLKESYPSDWIEYKFGYLFEFVGGMALSRSNLSNEGICYLHYGDIHKLSGNYIDVEKEYDTIPKLNERLENINEKYFLRDGDIVFADASEDYEGIGKSVVVINKTNIPFISGLHTIIARDKSNLLDNSFKRFFLSDWNIRKQIMVIASGISVYGISKENIKNIRTVIPPINEQRKIASILSTWDKAIELKEKLIEQKKEQKKGLMQKLLTGKVRLPGFEGEWKKAHFDEIFDKLPLKKHQIKSSEYLNSGKYPVVDQGQKKVVAYSNNEEKVIKTPNTGLIIFGDHTREIKFIDFDFVIGADGTQVLTTKNNNDVKFYYYHLLNQKIPNTGYNRHFKFLKEMIFYVPPLKEQKIISNILSLFDKDLDLLESEISTLKEQKKGLMQLLLTGKVRVKV